MRTAETLACALVATAVATGCAGDGSSTAVQNPRPRLTQSAFGRTAEDKQYVRDIMFQVSERGKFANWIAPPTRGVFGRPVDFEYVRM